MIGEPEDSGPLEYCDGRCAGYRPNPHVCDPPPAPPREWCEDCRDYRDRTHSHLGAE